MPRVTDPLTFQKDLGEDLFVEKGLLHSGILPLHAIRPPWVLWYLFGNDVQPLNPLQQEGQDPHISENETKRGAHFSTSHCYSSARISHMCISKHISLRLNSKVNFWETRIIIHPFDGVKISEYFFLISVHGFRVD